MDPKVKRDFNVNIAYVALLLAVLALVLHVL